MTVLFIIVMMKSDKHLLVTNANDRQDYLRRMITASMSIKMTLLMIAISLGKL